MKNRYIPNLVLMAWMLLLFLSCKNSNEVNLPIYNPADFNPALVDESLLNKSENHKVSDFHLINQNGETVTAANYNGKIYVTDFFFTRCQTICPVMTNNMAKVQKVFSDNEEVMFLSISVTPEMDSIPILKDYAVKKGVIDAKWNVTTGNKKHIYELARKSYFAVVEEGDGGLQDFIHTTKFILVDKKKQIRGVYDGTANEDIDRLIQDINILTSS